MQKNTIKETCIANNLENGISVIIKVKRYLCKKCRKYSQVRLNGIYEDFCNFSIKMKNKAVELRKRVWDSLRNLSWTFNVFNGINMSYETIRKSLLTFDGLYYVNTDLKFSGYAAYDVQWIRIERKWYYRHVLLHLPNFMIYIIFSLSAVRYYILFKLYIFHICIYVVLTTF